MLPSCICQAATGRPLPTVVATYLLSSAKSDSDQTMHTFFLHLPLNKGIIELVPSFLFYLMRHGTNEAVVSHKGFWLEIDRKFRPKFYQNL